MNDGPGPVYGGDPQRTGRRLSDHESAYDVFADFIQGGLAQVALLGVPAFWIVIEIQPYTTEVGTAAMVAIVWLSLLITAFRGGYLSVDRPWPTLTNRRFGTAGWRVFLTRSVFLSATLLVVVHAGVLTQLLVGSFVANVLVVIALSSVALALLPALSTREPRARLARFGYCLLGVGVAGTGTLATSGSGPSVAFVTALLLVMAAVDARPIDAVRAISG